MRIAFDVKGTLDGYNETKVRALFKALHDAGHHVVVWSNSYGYAHDMAEQLKALGFNTEADSKYSDSDAEDRGNGMFDIAIEDDTSQTWLAAKKLVFVHELPDDVERFAEELTKC